MPSAPRIPIRAPRQGWGVVLAGAALLALLLSGLLVGLLTFGDDDQAAPATRARVVATVPSVVGLTPKRADAVLARAGLESAVERRRSSRPRGRVLGQKPRAGSRVERGVAILLIVSSGRSRPVRTTTTETTATETKPATTTATEKKPATTSASTLPERPTDTVIVKPEPPLSEVPGVLDVGFVDAARFVESRGYVADTYVIASRRPRGIVLRQSPRPGTQLARGRTVRLYLALGSGERGAVELRDFTGLPEALARDLLHRAGLTVRTVDRTAPSRRRIGMVLFQRPAAGASLPVLSQVALYVGR